MEELPDYFNIQNINTGDHIGRLHADIAVFSSCRIFCLPIRYLWETKKTVGLGLVPTGQYPGEFYRVGVFTANSTGWFDRSTLQDKKYRYYSKVFKCLYILISKYKSLEKPNLWLDFQCSKSFGTFTIN